MHSSKACFASCAQGSVLDTGKNEVIRQAVVTRGFPSVGDRFVNISFNVQGMTDHRGPREAWFKMSGAPWNVLEEMTCKLHAETPTGDHQANVKKSFPEADLVLLGGTPRASLAIFAKGAYFDLRRTPQII